jgi:hypothetical protein
VAASALAFAIHPQVTAQVKVGNFTTKLSGVISPGYSADYGNQTGSDHSWAFGGAGTLSGDYYTPNFLSYDASFYINQSRANSNFQSISNASGIDLSSEIFGGSHFPGSVTWSKAYDREGDYDIPGLANYVTHGNSNTVGINWSENLPDAPSFSAGWQTGSSNYTVYGIDEEGTNNFDSLNLHTSYNLSGFGMGAFYNLGTSNSVIPEVFAEEQSAETDSSSGAYGFNLSHRLPLSGSASAGINHSDYSTTFLGSTSSGTVDLTNAIATIHPTQKLAVTTSLNYSDNLTGQLIEAIVAAGGAVPSTSNERSDSLDLMTEAGYAATEHLETEASWERRSQTFLGENYTVDSYSAGASYMRELFGGTFNGSSSLTENLGNQDSENNLGFSANASYSRIIAGWHTNGTFGYAQNVETLVVTYMNSYYNYNFNTRRNWGKFNIDLGAGGGRTALTGQAGTESDSQSYDGAVGYGKWLNASGGYTKADGQALLTGAGLTTSPIPPPVLPSSLFSLYGGKSYSLGLSSTPVKNLILTAAYAKSDSNVFSQGLSSSNSNNEFTALIQYQTRKLSWNSGYARLVQGFSGSGVPAQMIGSYYFGVSRWFNIF